MKTYFKIERISLDEYVRLGGTIDNYSTTITEIIDKKTALVYTKEEQLELTIDIIDMKSFEDKTK